jgi:hypothetical protein
MRDFLKEAQSTLTAPKPLKKMLAEDKAGLIGALVKYLGNPDIYKRKYAAFCLGQIGDTGVLNVLQSAHDRESVAGAKEAMAAALVALRSVPPSATEEQRAQAVENVYDGKPWDSKPGSAG